MQHGCSHLFFRSLGLNILTEIRARHQQQRFQFLHMALNFGQTIWDTLWEQEKETKNPSLPNPSKIIKNWTIHECISCMKFLFPKLFVTIFSLG
jgi:hypothetical protein